HRHAVGFCRIEQIERRHDRRRHTLEYPCLEAARTVWQPLAGAVRDEAEIVGLDIRPIRQRRFIDIENEGGLADPPSASLDIGARGGENRGDVAVVVFGLVGEQYLLDLVDIQGSLRRRWNTHLCVGRASGRARDAQRAGKGNEAERSSKRVLALNRELASLFFRAAHFRAPYLRSSRRILSAVRSDNAAIVSVGLAVAPVGNVLLPTRYKLS